MHTTRGPLDALFDGLPVVLLDFDGLANLTAAQLRHWAAEHAEREAAGAYPMVELDGARVPERVTAAYWMRTIRAGAQLSNTALKRR